MTAHSPIRQTADARPQDFAHVTEWVFDLDNTLYPRHTNLFSQIDQRMTVLRPMRSPTGPPISVPKATAARNTNR